MVPGQTFRYGDWKLLTSRQGPGGPERRWGDRAPAEAGSLFHLGLDPGETIDFSDDYPGVVNDLQNRMKAAMRELARNTRKIGKHPEYSKERQNELKAK